VVPVIAAFFPFDDDQITAALRASALSRHDSPYIPKCLKSANDTVFLAAKRQIGGRNVVLS
jgi:hypothetical protein